MATACPFCGRPNSDTATRCLYCVQPLSGTERAPEARPASALSVSSTRHLLILIPANGPDDHLVSELAQATGVSLYDARLFLSSARPRLFRFVDDETEARRLSRALADSKIAHYVTSEASVLALPIVRASGLAFHERHFELRLEGRDRVPVSLPYSEVILLVRGEITRERQDEKRFGTKRTVSRRLTSGLRLHVYSREASFAIEIDPETFDFEGLDADRTSSMILNFEKLVSRLSALTPNAELSSDFEYEPVTVSRAKESSDVTDVLAEGGRGSVGVLHDNEASFRFYARWSYRLARHLARSGHPAE